MFKNAGKINEYKIMKAFFIFKDGELVGSPIGYTSIKGAKKICYISMILLMLVKQHHKS